MSGDAPALFELNEEMPAPPSVTAVVPNPSGHIGFIHPPEQPNPYAAFFDTGGGLLSLWSGQGFSLDPLMARELASALHAWSRKNDPVPRSKFDGDPLEALHAAEQLLSELQVRVVRARRYAVRHSSDPRLLDILGGAGDEVTA